jgi:hypothetical protein
MPLESFNPSKGVFLMTRRSTGPLTGIFTKPPEIMADILSSREFFSGGPAAGLRVLTVYMAYASRRLSAAQKHSLERAKEMLVDRTRKIEVERA